MRPLILLTLAVSAATAGTVWLVLRLASALLAAVMHSLAGLPH